MRRPWRWTCLFSLVAAGCAPFGPSVGSDGRLPPAGGLAPSKTITVGTLIPINGFAPWDVGTTQGGAAAMTEAYATGLVVDGYRGGLEPRLAERLPSLNDGTIAILPDGRMQTTWKLRPNVKWHDGRPFTATDLQLSVQLYQHPDLPKGNTAPAAGRIERIEAPDPLTAIITWRSVFAQALQMDVRNLWPYPTHILAEPFLGDRQAFQAHPFFTTEFVGLGPFRLVEFGIGDGHIFERFDDYFLGRPKVDRIVVRVIPEPNTLLANLHGAAVDIAMEQTLALDVFAQLRDEWRESSAGTVVVRQGIWRYTMFQFKSDAARLPEIHQDVRIRRGLYYAFDRDAVRELVLPGFPDTSADSFMLQNDPRASLVGQPFARYRHDPVRAVQNLADAGWRRGSDGRMRNAAGQQVQIPFKTTVQYLREHAAIADYWRQLGIDVQEEVEPPHLARDAEYKANFAGIDIAGRGSNERVLPYLDGRLVAGPANRWTAANVLGWANPEFDRLHDRLNGTLDDREQGLTMREMGEILASELPVLPTYFAVWLAAVGKGIRALDDYPGAVQSGGVLRNAHLWDRE